MTLEEIKQLKSKMEQEIKASILLFESQAGVNVSAIDICRIDSSSKLCENSILSCIQTKLDL